MGFYQEHILPRLTHWVCGQKDFAGQRQKTVPLAMGNTLEIGIGSGLNLPFYDPGRIRGLWGIDPCPRLVSMARDRASALPFDVRFMETSSENIPLETHAMDTVLVTYTLCSIPDISKALDEMRRVLKPRGTLIFCEHGQTPDHGVNTWQDRLNPAWHRLSGGCNLNRPIPGLIENSGFKIKTLDARYISHLKLAGFNYRGIAVPA